MFRLNMLYVYISIKGAHNYYLDQVEAVVRAELASLN